MRLRIELDAEVEARLARAAARQGITLAAWAHQPIYAKRL